MSELAAIARLDLAPEELRRQLRTVLGQPLRRAGTFGRATVTGIISCTRAAEELSTALLWSSAYGARAEVNTVLKELAQDVELMPFDFITTLPVVAAVHAAQHAPSIKFGVFMPAVAGAPETWPRLLQLALCWLDAERCQQVICGWVEEARDCLGAADHTSHWLALTHAGLVAAPLATMQMVCGKGQSNAGIAVGPADSVACKGAELVPALQTWLTSEASMFPVGQIQFTRIAPD